MPPFQPCRRYRPGLDSRQALKRWEKSKQRSSERWKILTFNECRRLNNIIADIPENIIYVLLSLYEDLKRGVDVVQLSCVRVHQRVVTIASDHRHSAIQVSCHIVRKYAGKDLSFVIRVRWKDKNVDSIKLKCFTRINTLGHQQTTTNGFIFWEIKMCFLIFSRFRTENAREERKRRIINYNASRAAQWRFRKNQNQMRKMKIEKKAASNARLRTFLGLSWLISIPFTGNHCAIALSH